jgi:hypothetical protein
MRARLGLRMVLGKLAQGGAALAGGSDESLDAWARAIRAQSRDDSSQNEP